MIRPFTQNCCLWATTCSWRTPPSITIGSTNNSLCSTALRQDRHYEDKKQYFAWLKSYLRAGPSAWSRYLKQVNEQETLLEIRRQVDVRYDAGASRLQALGILLDILSHLRRSKESCFSYKVLRYGCGYLLGRVLAPGR